MLSCLSHDVRLRSWAFHFRSLTIPNSSSQRQFVWYQFLRLGKYLLSFQCIIPCAQALRTCRAVNLLKYPS